MSFFTRAVTAFGLVAAAAAVNAQSANDPSAALAVANGTLQAIDQNRVGEIYTKTPAFVRTKFKEADFVAGIARERAKLSPSLVRSWTNIERVIIQNNDQGLPPGTVCANVIYAALSGNAVAGLERVSVCQQDGNWLPAGYNTAPAAK